MARRILVDLAPLRSSRDFRWLFAGQLASVIGDQLTAVAVPYQVFSMTRSSLQVGLVSLAQVVPLVAFSLVGGSVADAVDRRRLLVVVQGALCVMSVLLALNAAQAHPARWVLYLVPAVASGLTGFTRPTYNAVIPGLVPKESYSAAYALWQIMYQVGAIVGPAGAGLMLTHVGLAWVYGADAITFLLGMGAVAAMGPQPIAHGARRPGVGSILEGLRFIRGNDLLQGVYVIDVNAMVLGMPRALFPAVAANSFKGSTTVLGLLYAAPAAGALVGASTTGWVANLRRQGLGVIVAVMIWGAAVASFGLVRSLVASLVLLAVAGWSDVISAVLRSTILQTSVPDRLRGRLSAVQIAVVQGSPKLGDLEAGAVAALTTTEISIVSGGLACILGAVLVGRRLPGFRAYRAGRGSTAGELT